MIPISVQQRIICHMGSQVSNRYPYLEEMKSRVDPGGRLCTKMVHLSADSHPSKYQPLDGNPTHRPTF